MADTKLSALTELAAGAAIDDEIYIRDISEASADESKRMTISNLLLSLTNLSALGTTPAGSDELLINDSGTIKKITVTNLVATVAQASQTEIEGQSDVNTYAPPDLLRKAPSATKAHALVDGAGARQTGYYNVSGAAQDDLGRYTVTWDVDFADALYTMIACVNETTACGTAVTDRGGNATTAGKVATYNNEDPHALADLPFYVAAWGDQ